MIVRWGWSGNIWSGFMFCFCFLQITNIYKYYIFGSNKYLLIIMCQSIFARKSNGYLDCEVITKTKAVKSDFTSTSSIRNSLWGEVWDRRSQNWYYNQYWTGPPISKAEFHNKIIRRNYLQTCYTRDHLHLQWHHVIFSANIWHFQ